LVVLPFIIPPSERTVGWKGRLLVGRWRLVDSNRVEVLVGLPGWVGVLIRELCGTGILVCPRDDCEIVLRIGQPRGLKPEQRDYLDDIASAGLVVSRHHYDERHQRGQKTNGTLV
jgi:hypothetical protein